MVSLWKATSERVVVLLQNCNKTVRDFDSSSGPGGISLSEKIQDMLLEINNLTKYYGKDQITRALDGVNLSVEKGDFIAIMGPSGSGKTTLLNLISTIDKPTSGNVVLDGKDITRILEKEISDFRRNQLGIVFQGFNLIDSLTVKENLAIPMVLEKNGTKEIESRVEEVSKLLGISELLDKHTYEISGGEAQRTAIGRAIFNHPSLLLADEPTGNLDSKNSRAVMELFSAINEKEGVTTLMVTHNPEAAAYCKKVIFIRDGRLYNQICRGDNQKQFFSQILDTLSFLSTESER